MQFACYSLTQGWFYSESLLRGGGRHWMQPHLGFTSSVQILWGPWGRPPSLLPSLLAGICWDARSPSFLSSHWKLHSEAPDSSLLAMSSPDSTLWQAGGSDSTLLLSSHSRMHRPLQRSNASACLTRLELRAWPEYFIQALLHHESPAESNASCFKSDSLGPEHIHCLSGCWHSKDTNPFSSTIPLSLG